MIRYVSNNDTQALLDIYNYYVLHTAVTFDIEPLTIKEFSEKIARINSDYPFLVYEENSEILGFAYGSKFRPKAAYNKTVESTVYVKIGSYGNQIGTKLYKQLLGLLKKEDYHLVLGVLTIPNEASVKLHEKFGFKQVAHLKEAGFKFGDWQDVGFWELKLH